MYQLKKTIKYKIQTFKIMMRVLIRKLIFFNYLHFLILINGLVKNKQIIQQKSELNEFKFVHSL